MSFDGSVRVRFEFGSSLVRVRFEFGSSSMIKVRVRVRFDEIEKFEVRSFTNTHARS